MRGRRGYLLAEALCALALAGLLAGTAAVVLSGAQRALRRAELRERADRAAREAVAVLRAAAATGNVIGLRGDTAIDLDLPVLQGPVCDIEPLALLLPPSAVSAGAPLTALLQAPSVDDVAAIRQSLSPKSAPIWTEIVIDSAQSLAVVGRCDGSDGWALHADAAQPRWRLALRDSTPEDLEVGATVRVGRPGRFALYNAGRGDWMLGWRRCAPDFFVCGVVQPVAGPLRTPAAGGLRIRQLASPGGWEFEARGAGSESNQVARATLYY